MEEKKVSIIIPAYNCEKFVKRTILSVVNQLYNNIEIIIIDDASTDSTKSIIQEYEKQYPNKIKGIYLEKNGRQANARKIGFEHSSGDYIMFVDSDDTITEYAISLFVSRAEEYDMDIVIGQSYINATDKFTSHYPQEWLKNKIIGPSKEKIAYNYIDRLHNEDLINSYSWLNCLWKRYLLEDPNLNWATNVYYNEDTVLMYQLYLNAKSMMFIPYVTYIYNVINENGYLASFHTKDKEVLNYTHKYYAYIWTYFLVRERLNKEMFFTLQTVCNNLTYMYFFIYKERENIRKGKYKYLSENEIQLFKESLIKFGTIAKNFTFSKDNVEEKWNIQELIDSI